MTTYEFALVVDGISPEDPDHDQRLADAGADDAMVFSDGDRTLVAFYRDADTPMEALWRAVAAIEAAYPDAGICQLDRDLVSTTDIADRIGVSRETVRKWVVGERVAGRGFPMPVGTVSRGTRVWTWSAVHEWLTTYDYEVDEACPIPGEVAAQFEADLLSRRTVAPPRVRLHSLPVPTDPRVGTYVTTAAESRAGYDALLMSKLVQVASGTDAELPSLFRVQRGATSAR